jgi:hypothetical protein
VEEQEHALHPTDGKDLSVKLDKAHGCADRINDEHATKAG